MAQETRVAPIEFSNAPTQVMLNIVEQKKQDALKKQQLEFEKLKYLRSAQEDEMKRRYENAQNFNTVLQNQDWTKETRDMFMSDLLKKFSNAKDTDSFDFRTNLGKQLGSMSQYNNIIKTVYSKADEFVRSMPDAGKQGFSADVFKNRFIKSALTNPDGTKKSLEQLQKDYNDNLAQEVYQSNKQDLYDISTAYNVIPELIKNAGVSTVGSATKSRSGNIGSSESSTVSYKPMFQYYDKKSGEVKMREDEFGYIDKDLYEQLTSIPSLDAMATRKAKEFIKNYNNSSRADKLSFLGSNSMQANSKFIDANGDGLPDALTDADIDLIKKGFLTNQVKRNILNTVKENTSQVVYNYNGSGSKSENGVDAFSDLDNAATDAFNKKQFLSVNTSPNPDLIIDYAEKSSGVKLDASQLKIIKGKDGRVGIYAADDIIKEPTTGEIAAGNVGGKKVYSKNGLIAWVNPDAYNKKANVGKNPPPTSVSKKKYNPDTGRFE